MSGFAANWLALRRPADRRARNAWVAAQLSAAFAGRPGVRVLDLGAGSGNNLAETSKLLPRGQSWLLTDSDATLLARVRPVPGVAVEVRDVDLRTHLEELFDPPPDLVTASAFFDLAGADWIDRLIGIVARTGAAFHAVLSYTGEERWHPQIAEDGPVLAAFHSDQRRDKGLGPALGPEAHAHLAHRLRAAGYRVGEGRADWQLTRPRDGALIDELAHGIAEAVRPRVGAAADRWRAARGAVEEVRIGHADLVAQPADWSPEQRPDTRPDGHRPLRA